jgi:hypothetical protein
MFRRVELAAREAWDALGALDGEDGWDADAWADALDPYFEEHDDIGIDAAARSSDLLILEEDADVWTVRQILDDPAGHHDWAILAEVDLRTSDAEGHAVVHITDVTS